MPLDNTCRTLRLVADSLARAQHDGRAAMPPLTAPPARLFKAAALLPINNSKENSR